MATAKLGGMTVPGVRTREESWESLVVYKRALNGRLRADTAAGTPYKRRWTLQTKPIPKADCDTLKDHIKNTLGGGEFAFWLDEFGDVTSTVAAFLDLSSVKDSRSHELPNRRTLSFTVIEA